MSRNSNEQKRNHVIQVAVPRPLHAVYDYAVPDDCAIPEVGARVRVPFGRSRTLAVCINTEVANPHGKLKAIDAVLDEHAFIPADLLELAHWMAGYYHHPLGEVLATMLPAAARKGASSDIDPPDAWRTAAEQFVNKRAHAQAALFDYLKVNEPQTAAQIVAAGHTRDSLNKLAKAEVVERCALGSIHDAEAPHEPTPAQSIAIDKLVAALGSYSTTVLEGVTGSGKTEVYLRTIAPVIASGRQVLVLVPEIALTPQTLRRFERRFARVGMLHSAMSDHERLQTWLKSRAGHLDVLIGTRSAIFTPFADLGLIVVDEEHDSSYKQQDSLRYSARDLASKRAHSLNIPVILGSATPSFETLYNVRRGRYKLLDLPTRAGGASMPSYHLIDMRGQNQSDGLSVPLERIIRKHLEAKGQVLLFLNRRGFAPTLLCAACGWQAQCSACDARLTLHKKPDQLACHHCGLKFEVPQTCEKCGTSALMPIGLGTQRTEAVLKRLFADVPVFRIDRDTTRSSRQLEAQFDKINEGYPCLMVGTQMLAKGHHFPQVTLVAVINADAGFLSPDFRAPERTAQLIVQVAGRAGRAERPGEVWIQTYQPDHPTLNSLIKEGYPGFATRELAEREKMGLPPTKPMAMLRAESVDAAQAQRFLEQCKQQLTGIEVMGPVPAPLARLANRSRFQLMLIGANRQQLHASLDRLQPPQHTHALRWSIDVDPYDSL